MERSKTWIDFLRALYEAWITDRPGQMAAALAYFGLFSIAPIIFLALSIANIFLEQVAYSQLFDRLAFALGTEAALWLEDSVRKLVETTYGGSTLVTVISIIALLLAASGMFFQIQFALNTVFKVSRTARNPTKTMILQRLFSFVMVIGVGLLLVLGSILNVVVNWFGSKFGYITGSGPLSTVIDSLIPFGIIALSLALIYKILPNADITWRDVWPGSIMATLLLLLAGMLLGIYFRIGGVGSAFEAAGTVAVILIAINVFAQIFLFGAVFIREYADWFGSKKQSTDDSTNSS